MKRIMIAALAILMLVAVSVGGVLPAMAENVHVHVSDVADMAEAPNGVGATSTAPLGPDFSGYKPTPYPANAKAINNAIDFTTMEPDGAYYLATDISVTTTYADTFTGSFYGNGKTVTTTVPLFAYLDDATVMDLTIKGEVKQDGKVGALAKEAKTPKLVGIVNNASVTSTTNDYAGGLIGAIWNQPGEVSFRYCVNNGRIDNASAASGKTDAGGFVGVIRGNTTATIDGETYTYNFNSRDVLILENCLNTGEVYGSNRIGGLIGVMGENAWLFYTATVKNCANTGNVTSTQHYAGGLTARISASTAVFENCLNTGDILTIAANKYGGGIAGLAEDPGCSTTFRNCRNEGAVDMTTHAGGILGLTNKTGTYYGMNGNVSPDLYFYDCVNVGDITGGANAGGISGVHSNARNMVFERCTNAGTVLGRDNTGGMAVQTAAASLLVKDCYNGATVTAYNGTNAGDAGGMVGEVTGNNMQATFENCINDALITGGRPGGIAGCAEGKTIKAQFIDCVNNGKIHSVTNYGGGIAGRFDLKVADGTVAGFQSQKAVLYLRCVNNGEIEVFQSQAGGMVGYVDGTFDGSDANTTVDYGEVYNMEIRECLNTGYIHSTDLNKNVSVGGLAGNVDGRLEIYDSANTGKVHGGGGAGGIAGSAGRGATIHRCVNTGDVTGGVYAGGIAGRMGGEHHKNNEALYCVTTGLVTHSGANLTDKSYSAGGVVGYGWGGLNVKYCAALGNVVANYPATGFDTDGNRLTVGAICGYQNSSSGTYQNNYHSGTITVNGGNPNVIVIAAKQAPTNTVDNSDNKISNLFTADAYPLYYHQATGVGANNPDPDTWEITAAKSTKITQAVDSNDFLNTLNTAAGAGTFIMATTCEGDSFPIHKDAVAAFDLARTHADADHDYFTNMKKDADYHWYECLCGAIAPEGKIEHSGTKATCKTLAVCSTCSESFGKLDANNHEDAVVWTATASGHSTEFSCCGDSVTDEAHDYENGVCTVCEYACLHDPAHENSTPATCQDAAYCGVCESSYGTVADHEYDTTKWVAGTDGDARDVHYNPCVHCDAFDVASETPCAGGTPTCTAPATCEGCGKGHGSRDPENHTSTGVTYAPDSDDPEKCSVLYACCGGLKDTVDHVQGTPATCTDKALCDNCGAAYGDVDLNNHAGTEATYTPHAQDATKHNKVYTCCNTPVIEAHFGGTPTCGSGAVCAGCQATYGEPTGQHIYSDGCTDRTCNVCGAVREGLAHKFGEWTVTKQPTETETGEQERVCESCGGKQTATISAITNPNSALSSINNEEKGSDAYIGVIVIAVAGALVVAAVAAFIVHKKNKKKK